MLYRIMPHSTWTLPWTSLSWSWLGNLLRRVHFRGLPLSTCHHNYSLLEPTIIVAHTYNYGLAKLRSIIQINNQGRCSGQRLNNLSKTDCGWATCTQLEHIYFSCLLVCQHYNDTNISTALVIMFTSVPVTSMTCTMNRWAKSAKKYAALTYRITLVLS